jgi:hypothetical protein
MPPPSGADRLALDLRTYQDEDAAARWLLAGQALPAGVRINLSSAGLNRERLVPELGSEITTLWEKETIGSSLGNGGGWR